MSLPRKPRARRLRTVGPMAVTTALLLFAGCGEWFRPSPPGGVVLISIDTLRPDRLGAYGHPEPVSPNIDELAARGVLFRQAISHAPSTLPAHASLLTSLLPQHHGASFANRRALPEAVETLAEILREQGVRTGAFTGGAQLAPEFGIGQGFEIYDAERLSLGQVATKALAWLDEQPQRPFFLFLHTYQVHHPYDLDPESRKVLASEYAGPLPDHISVDLLRSVNQGDLELSEADRRHILQAYDAGIRRMDEEFGTFLGELQERELFARSLVVFTSDHGEEFGEHGWWGWHSHSLYDELLAVPLVIKRPGNEGAGTVVQRQVRLIDVAPTILRALEIPAPPSFRGVDLFETGDEAPREALPAIALRDTEARDREAIRFRGWKWYHGSLFDLSADPLEQVDLAASRPEVFNRLQKILVDELEAGVSREGPEANPDRETMERLRSLGYVQ